MPGSSPLTRGKRDRRLPGRVDPRLIPAHAGKTTRVGMCECETGAHPRSRGENAQGGDVVASPEGSSPLTRGKLEGWRVVIKTGGLIPAHAGKTVRRIRVDQCNRAHPRSRGENLTGAEDQLVSLGSSPLTRGKREVVADVR